MALRTESSKHHIHDMLVKAADTQAIVHARIKTELEPPSVENPQGVTVLANISGMIHIDDSVLNDWVDMHNAYHLTGIFGGQVTFKYRDIQTAAPDSVDSMGTEMLIDIHLP
jgi:hypothetical protein